MMKKQTILSALLCFVAIAGFTQDDDLHFKTNCDQYTVYVDQPFVINFYVSKPIEKIEEPTNWREFELIGEGKPTTMSLSQYINGEFKQINYNGFKYKVYVSKVGEFEFPQLTFIIGGRRYKSEEGTVKVTPPIAVKDISHTFKLKTVFQGGDSIAAGKQVVIKLSFPAKPDRAPEIDLKDFKNLLSAPSHTFSARNDDVSYGYSFLMTAPSKSGVYTIPPITVRFGGEPYTTEPYKIKVCDYKGSENSLYTDTTDLFGALFNTAQSSMHKSSNRIIRIERANNSSAVDSDIKTIDSDIKRFFVILVIILLALLVCRIATKYLYQLKNRDLKEGVYRDSKELRMMSFPIVVITSRDDCAFYNNSKDDIMNMHLYLDVTYNQTRFELIRMIDSEGKVFTVIRAQKVKGNIFGNWLPANKVSLVEYYYDQTVGRISVEELRSEILQSINSPIVLEEFSSNAEYQKFLGNLKTDMAKCTSHREMIMLGSVLFS